MSSLELEMRDYAVTEVWEMLNKKLQAEGIGNCTPVFPL